MGIWAKMTKGLADMFSKAGTAASVGIAATGTRLFTGLNRFWVGVAGTLVAFLGINVAEGQSSGEALLEWMLGTTEGWCFVAILVFVVWVLFFRKGAAE